MSQRPTSTRKRCASVPSKHAVAPQCGSGASRPTPRQQPAAVLAAGGRAGSRTSRRRRRAERSSRRGRRAVLSNRTGPARSTSCKQDLTETAGTATPTAGQGENPTRLLMTGRSTRRGPRARRDTRRLRGKGSHGTAAASTGQALTPPGEAPGAPGSQGPREGWGSARDQCPLQPHGPTRGIGWR